MRRTILYIAMSLDGYIADEFGRVKWLEGQDPADENEGTYPEFIQTVDTVIMGWKTYHQIVTELSPDEWVYSNLTTYVITHHEKEPEEKIRFVQDSPVSLIRNLKNSEGRDLWICGGAEIVRQLMQDDLIDRFYISVIPIVLGDGIRLFGKSEKRLELKLLDTRSWNGITELRYEMQKDPV